MTEKSILVTGGAGYIGAHVCKALAREGFIPVAYDNLVTGSPRAVKWGPFEQGDIRNRDRLREVIKQHQPHAIMHFAALIQVGESVVDPAQYYENNVYGSFCLLEEAKAQRISAMVFSSTAAVYGMPQQALLAEDHPLQPINPYGHTKLAMENMIRDYASAYGLRYAILRYFNAAGADLEGQLGSAYAVDTHLIPLLMQTASGLRNDIKIFGTDYDTPDGTAIRDFIHVSDLAEAHISALKHLLSEKESITLNLGTSKGHSVKETLELARHVTQCPIPADICPRRAGDPSILVADAKKAETILGWKPVCSSLNTIIESAWKWRQRQNVLGRTEALIQHLTEEEPFPATISTRRS